MQIYHIQCSARCQLCGGAYETINHLVSRCPVLVKKEHKPRHDHFVSHVHWILAKQAGYPVMDVWWKHSPSRFC